MPEIPSQNTYDFISIFNLPAPEATKTEVKKALFEAAKQVKPSDGREKIMKKALKDLKS